MYIRRKVFSVLRDENGEEKLFSVKDTELTEEEPKKEKKNNKKKVKALLAAGIPLTALAAAGVYQKIKGDKLDAKAQEIKEKALMEAGKQKQLAVSKKAWEEYKKQAKKEILGKGDNWLQEHIDEPMSNAAKKIVEKSKGAVDATKEGAKKLAGKARGMAKDVIEKVKGMKSNKN